MKCSRNKYLFSFFIFIFSFFNSFSQYTIPWATQQPAWVFPIWFEDGNGQKDTVYIGYDTNASIYEWGGIDTIFGEKLVGIDTSKFNVSLCIDWFSCSGLCDSVIKSTVSNFTYLAQCGNAGAAFLFINGELPLKISWDVTLFRSDSLPFPDQSPAPGAQGRIDYDPWNLYPNGGSGNCFFNEPVLLTDTGIYSCIKKDSVIFYYTFDTTQNSPIPYFSFSIEPWTGNYVGISEKNNNDLEIAIAPNPFTNDAIITIPYKILHESEKLFFSLYDVLGNEVKNLMIETSEYRLKRNNLPEGIYFYRFYNNIKVIGNGKLIIQ